MYRRKNVNHKCMHLHKKRRVWPIGVVMFLAFLVGAGGYAYYFISHISLDTLVTSEFARSTFEEFAGDELSDGFELLPTLLGLEEPQTYLFLFLNNTEM